MVLVAVIIGYILGVAPVVVYFLWQNRNVKALKVEEQQEENTTKNIVYEWLYGKEKEEPVNEKKQVSQDKIFEEYVGG